MIKNVIFGAVEF